MYQLVQQIVKSEYEPELDLLASSEVTQGKAPHLRPVFPKL
jgi:hypothetical protein